MSDQDREPSTRARAPEGACERIIGELSDYERGIWAPLPLERVRITIAGDAAPTGTFVGTAYDASSITLYAVVVVHPPPLSPEGEDELGLYEWNELAPAPPLGCDCRACCGASPDPTTPSQGDLR